MSVEPLTRTELILASQVLSLAAEQFVNHGCNDFDLPNDEAHREFVTAMFKAEGRDDEDLRWTLGRAELCVSDYEVMDHLGHRCAALGGGKWERLR